MKIDKWYSINKTLINNSIEYEDYLIETDKKSSSINYLYEVGCCGKKLKESLRLKIIEDIKKYPNLITTLPKIYSYNNEMYLICDFATCENHL